MSARFAARAIVPVAAVWLLALALAGCGGSGSASGGGTAARTGARTNGHAKPGHARRHPRPRRVARLVPPPNSPPRSVSVPVLTYHRVNPLRPGANAIETDLTIEPRDFAAQMRALAKAGLHTISQKQLFDALFHGAKLPAKPVMITVDDGYVDDVRNILPVLRRLHMVATFFPITGRFHEPGFLNPDQIRELDRAGMDIGSHTRSHLDLTTMSAAQLRAEIPGSRRALERVLHHPIYAFCYPSGRFDDTVVAAVRDAGFTLGYTTEGGTTESSTAALTMPRLHVGRGASPQSVVALASSG